MRRSVVRRGPSPPRRSLRVAVGGDDHHHRPPVRGTSERRPPQLGSALEPRPHPGPGRPGAAGRSPGGRAGPASHGADGQVGTCGQPAQERRAWGWRRAAHHRPASLPRGPPVSTPGGRRRQPRGPRTQCRPRGARGVVPERRGRGPDQARPAGAVAAEVPEVIADASLHVSASRSGRPSAAMPRTSASARHSSKERRNSWIGG